MRMQGTWNPNTARAQRHGSDAAETDSASYFIITPTTPDALRCAMLALRVQRELAA